ncbi:hypothetical protein F5X99DRAFT_427839 [Biscogniauxia marginata]|nr:hypothetical protein F5X99DRAFT_427839 [Biscogniauxia marginata]
MASLMDLGNEILIMIVDLIQDTSPNTIPAVALMNSRFRKLAQYSQHRTVTLQAGGDMDDRLGFIEKNELLPAVRCVKVMGNAKDPMTLLCLMLPRMTGLRDFVIQMNCIPRPVLETLRGIPGVRLHARTTRPVPRQPDEDFNMYSLQDNPNLYALDVSIDYTSAESCLRITRPLKRVLLSCPNLRVLKLDIDQPSSGCDIYSTPAEYCGCGFVEGERLPPLEELILTNYPFGHEPARAIATSSPSVQTQRDESDPAAEGEEEEEEEEELFDEDDLNIEVNAIGYPLKGWETDFWADTFDWSRLRRLQIGLPEMALRMAPHLTSLQEVEFCRDGGAWQEDTTRAFYAQLPASALSSVSVRALSRIGVSGIARHGASLRRLRIHRDEDRRRSWRDGAVDAASLRAIRDACPGLEELALDAARGGGRWPRELLDVAASFPRLRALTLFFELGVADGEDPVRPYVTFAAAGELFRYLRSRGRSPALGRALFVAGCAPGIGFGYPSPEAFWPEYNSSAFECVVAERDDELARGAFTVRCTELGEEHNAVLRRVVETGENPRELLGIGPGHDLPEAFKVAYEGPTPVSQWDSHY